MNYNQNQIMNAFKLYANLSLKGELPLIEGEEYVYDDHIRGLVDQFASEVNCIVLITSDQLLLLPLSMGSPFHISNESLKKEYLPSKAQNSDIYLMYFCMILFYGLFYDSYQTTEPILDFIKMESWLDAVNEAVESISSLDETHLTFIQKDMQYNWKIIIEKWTTMDDTNESVKKQDGRTQSRLSFLNGVVKFLDDQGLVQDLGSLELGLTEKSKDIVSRYYMDSEYNRGILEIIYNEEQAVN